MRLDDRDVQACLRSHQVTKQYVVRSHHLHKALPDQGKACWNLDGYRQCYEVPFGNPSLHLSDEIRQR